jgi:hypothetical protein
MSIRLSLRLNGFGLGVARAPRGRAIWTDTNVAHVHACEPVKMAQTRPRSDQTIRAMAASATMTAAAMAT